MKCIQSKKKEMIPVIIPGTQFRSKERRRFHFRESNFTNFPWGMPQDPPRSLCLRHSTFAPAARTVHVRQLNHCIRYFQMLRKTLMSYRQGNPLTFQWKQIYDGRRKRIRLRTAGVIQASVSVFFTNKLLVPCVCSDASYVCLTWLAWLAYCASPCSNAQWELS